MRLEDVVDLEAQLALDRDRDPEALRARDRTIFLRLPDAPTRAALLADWLTVLRERGENPAFGRRIEAGFRWARRLLVITGLLVGWGTAAGLLAFSEGGPPVNVGTFLLVVVAAQLTLVALFLVGLPITRAFPNAPLFGDVRLLIRSLATALGRLGARAEARLEPARRSKLEVVRSRLRSRASLYGPIERWTLVGTAQRFGIAFNVGILAACLRLVVFSDLAFGWSTTAEAIDTDVMHRVVRTLSVPWAELAPEAVPSRELVEKSRYFRLERRYAQAPAGTKGDARLVGGWWPFLLAATVTYGLAPRVLLAVVAAILRARALERVPLDTPEIDRVVRRLRAPRIRTRGDAPQPSPEDDGRGQREPSVRPTAGGACVVVRWRNADAPDAVVRSTLAERFGWTATRVLDAIGDQDAPELANDEADQPVVVVAESWEPPDKGLRRWLGALRARMSAERPIWVVLFGGRSGGALEPASPEDLAVWRDRLELVEDPYLGVESVEAA